ncbi:MAG: outer membrane protein assembly factor BamB, partial [Phenylobacterium sp.]
MKLFRKVSLIAALAVALAACSSSDDEEEIVVAELVDITAQFEPKIQWQAQVGDGVDGHFSRLMPAINQDVLYSAGRNGTVAAFNLASGEQLWSVDVRKDPAGYFGSLFSATLPARISGGLTVAYGKVFLGTENGDVMALDITTGAVVWRKSVRGEVIAPPATGEGLVIVNTGAGYLVALHPDDGDQRWEYEQEVPALTLRGISTPVVENGG